ncbi:DUF1753-domain-containing protein, partial [Aureobasidium melanogenum]
MTTGALMQSIGKSGLGLEKWILGLDARELADYVTPCTLLCAVVGNRILNALLLLEKGRWSSTTSSSSLALADARFGNLDVETLLVGEALASTTYPLILVILAEPPSPSSRPSRKGFSARSVRSEPPCRPKLFEEVIRMCWRSTPRAVLMTVMLAMLPDWKTACPRAEPSLMPAATAFCPGIAGVATTSTREALTSGLVNPAVSFIIAPPGSLLSSLGAASLMWRASIRNQVIAEGGEYTNRVDVHASRRSSRFRCVTKSGKGMSVRRRSMRKMAGSAMVAVPRRYAEDDSVLARLRLLLIISRRAISENGTRALTCRTCLTITSDVKGVSGSPI